MNPNASKSFHSTKAPRPTAAAKIATVVNISTAPAGTRWHYIGRPMPSRGLAGSKWANNCKITEDTPTARTAACRQFLFKLHASGLFYHVSELRGETLGCWCDPKQCHGHTLAALANAMELHEAPCPHCKAPVHSSPMQKKTAFHFSEFWKCHRCGAFGFQDRGTLDLFPTESQPEPALAL